MNGKSEKVRLIDLRQVAKGAFARGAYKLLGGTLERFLGVKEINAAYRRFLNDKDKSNYFAAVLRTLKIDYGVSDEELAKIPKDGPLFIVSNHPYGCVDSLILSAIFSGARPDYKVLANSILFKVEAVRPWLLPVNPFGGREAARENVRSMRDAKDHLRKGGCLAMFPSGEVSSLRLQGREITDPAWSKHAGTLVRDAKATVIPVFFEGHNSALFHAAGLVNPRARTALLLREFMQKRDSMVRLRIGDPIPFRKLEEFGTDEALTDFLRLKTYLLGKRPTEPVDKPAAKAAEVPTTAMEPIIPPVNPALLLEEIQKLPPAALLVENSTFKAFIFHGESCPLLLREIGRLREVTFREVGEGTGKACDLDEYDTWYEHLVLWDAQANTIAGAYRMGLTDRILDTRGKRGLYTASLFHFRSGFYTKLNPALEMGRSFIRKDYQKRGQCMPLLWRAIMRFCSQNPRYKMLFGPVSISAEYSKASRDIILAYLRNHKVETNLEGLVRAKNPPRRITLKSSELASMINSVDDIEQVSNLVSELEHDKKPVPVLLKHYLKLNGRMISFNIDPDFGDCLDGLVMVDFTKADTKFMNNMMGLKEYAAFCAYNGVDPDNK